MNGLCKVSSSTCLTLRDMHTYTPHIAPHTCTHVYNAYTNCMFAYVCTCTHAHTCTHTAHARHTYAHIHTYAHVHVHIHTTLHMYACMHTYTPHTCTCTLHTCHTHVHTCASTGMQVSTLVRLQANHLAVNSLLRLPKLNWPCGKYIHYLQAAFSFGLGSIYTPAFILSSLGSQGT